MNTVLKKLRYKNQNPVLVINAPAQIMPILNDFDSAIHHEARQSYDFILCFSETMAEGAIIAARVVKHLNHDGLLWFCYPKGTSVNYRSDINRERAWNLFKVLGFRPVAQIAVDDDWSALRFREARLVKSGR